jgi:hypothetical protein
VEGVAEGLATAVSCVASMPVISFKALFMEAVCARVIADTAVAVGAPPSAPVAAPADAPAAEPAEPEPEA